MKCIECNKEINEEKNAGTDVNPLCQPCYNRMAKEHGFDGVKDTPPGSMKHKQCPSCAEKVLSEAVKCRYCGHYFVKRKNRVLQSVILGFVLVLLIVLFGSFHFLTDAFTIIPKSHFTFSMTITSVDEVVKTYNERTLGERLRGDQLFDHLIGELQKRQLIQRNEGEEKPVDNLY